MTIQTIDFDKLSLMDALDLAILVEEEAQERYEEFAAQMDVHHTADAATFFRFMAGNEKKHGEQLAGQRRQRFGDAPRRVSRAMLWDVEAPTYERARAFMSPRQAMQVALEAEIKAHDYFAAALERVTDAEVRTLFEELRQEEIEHQRLVRAEIEKLPPSPELDADDFVDEPVGH